MIFIDRTTGAEREEKIFGHGPLRWLYDGRSAGRFFRRLLSQPVFSKLVGLYQNSSWSRKRIDSFVRDYGIPMGEFEEKTFRSFNDFFIRKFRPGARPFTGKKEELPAFAEGRYLAYESVGDSDSYPVKGISLSPTAILGGVDKAQPFQRGPLLIARLCPTDYHRFHYPDDGSTVENYRIAGRLHSVNPIALKTDPEIFLKNERKVSILQTKNFGRLATVEVGALCVGKIIQSHPAIRPFRRGDEKGYFLFGGSTILLFGERGAWRPDDDLLNDTSKGREVLVRLGERVAGRQEFQVAL